MWLCLALLELFCAPQYDVPDTIFAYGNEDMLISTDRPASIAWTIDSTNNNATFVTSSTYLNDGKVAIPTRMTWDVGSQTTANFTRIQSNGSLNAPTIHDPGLMVLALLCPATPYAIPAGVSMQFSFANFSGFFGKTVNATFVQLNNGATMAIGIYNNAGFGDDYIVGSVNAKIFNNLNGATWATTGQIFDVGEFWFGSLQEFKSATDPKIALVDNITNRRSHNNTNQPLFGPSPYRQLTAGLVPMSDASAYSGTNNFMQSMYALAGAKSALAIARLYQRGTTTVDTAALNQLTIFGRPGVSGVGPLAGVKDASGLWTANVMIEESPP